MKERWARSGSRTRERTNSANDAHGRAKSPSIRRAWRMPSATLIDRHIGAGIGTGVQGPRANQSVVVLLLDDMRAPAGNPRAHKDGGVQIAGKTHQHVRHRGVEVEIGMQAFFFTHD